MKLIYRFFIFQFAVVFAVSLLLLFPIFYFFLKIEVNYPVVFKLKRIWARLLFLGFFSRIEVEGKEHIPENDSFIICPNHSSYLDIIAMYLVIDKLFIFMAKSELSQWPLFGIFFKTMDISVNRKSPINAAKAFIRAKRELDAGRNVVLFPEGTIPKDNPKLIPFKDGAFKMAFDSNKAILPITFTNNYGIIGALYGEKLRVAPGKTKAIISAPLFPSDFDDCKALKDATFAQIQHNLPS
jgi:1-acyl-sn-glycerol-3-phosphate acyltransferase